MSLTRRFASSQRATAAIEFALTVPVLLILLAGIVEFGRAFLVFTVTNRLATQYAITWADCSDSLTGTCSTELSSYTASSSIANVFPQLIATGLTLRMFQVSMSGTTPSVTYSYPSGASLSASETTLAQSTFTTACSTGSAVGVIVTASYAHSLIYFQALMSPFLSSHLSPSYSVAQQKC